MAWIDDRPGGYDPDLFWDEENQEWNSTYVIMPGSRVEHVLVVSDKGYVYFGVV